MSILLFHINVLFFIYSGRILFLLLCRSLIVLIFLVHVLSSLSSTIIDSEIGDVNIILPCPIDRSNWTSPSILQWYRSNNNYSKPLASQFDNYPVHIDDLYRNKYRLFSNGSLNIESVQLNDNDTFECRLILIDRGLLDVKDKYLITFRVNGMLFEMSLVFRLFHLETILLEHPRFVNLSKSLQIASHYSTVYLICQIYGVPTPTVTWYKIQEKNKQTIGNEDLELLSTDKQQYVYSLKLMRIYS